MHQKDKLYDFVEEYGDAIDLNMRRLESENGGLPCGDCSAVAAGTPLTHLTRHGITEIGRARMIDWMFEVLTAFKMSEQTFFLSVQYMDRYIAESPKQHDLAELHLIGITCMFIASKYEDITPLFMQTIVIRIGHHRFSRDAVLEQERDILQTLSFKLSAVPTVLEFLDRYILTHPYFKAYPLGKIHTVTKYLAYLQTHHI